MPYNGSGLFSQLHNWVVDKTNNVLVTASRFQTTYDDMADAFSNCMTRDGQSPALADIPMGGFNITGLADGVAASDAATVAQLGSGNIYVARAYIITGNPTCTIATKIALNAVDVDPFNEWDVVTNRRWTPVATGLYIVHAHLAMSSSTTTGINLNIYEAGLPKSTHGVTANASGVQYVFDWSWVANITSLAQYFEVYGTVITGIGTFVNGATNSYVEITRIGNSF